MEKKKIGIMIPCYNEQENIVQICNAVVKEITEELPQYDYASCRRGLRNSYLRRFPRPC